MRNSGASVDDAVENFVDKRVDNTINGIVTVNGVITDEVQVDILSSKDGSISINITSLATPNIENIGNGTLPTVDPAIPGRFWNDAGTVKVSI